MPQFRFAQVVCGTTDRHKIPLFELPVVQMRNPIVMVAIPSLFLKLVLFFDGVCVAVGKSCNFYT